MGTLYFHWSHSNASSTQSQIDELIQLDLLNEVSLNGALFQVPEKLDQLIEKTLMPSLAEHLVPPSWQAGSNFTLCYEVVFQ